MAQLEVSNYLRTAVADANALRTLASEEPGSLSPSRAQAAAELVLRIQAQLDRTGWNQKVDPRDFAGPDLIGPVGGVTADSCHALAFHISDKLLQDVVYILSCATRDHTRKGDLLRVFDEQGVISGELVTRFWEYVRDYLVSQRCPAFEEHLQAILEGIDEEALRGQPSPRTAVGGAAFCGAVARNWESEWLSESE